MNRIKIWLKEIGWGDWNIEVASADASFRSYYRLSKNSETYVLMDSSLLLESLVPFININERLSICKVRAPRIIVKNMILGYLILEDFGSTHYLNVLNEENYQNLYKKAIDEIVKMQQAETKGLPLYDKDFLCFEMDLMQEWYLEKYLDITLNAVQKNIISKSLEKIADIVLEQPQGAFVHRDYHSRNIMLTSKGEIGVIDFQDARVGAVTYDLVSLLRDCYIEWDKDKVVKLALYYRDTVSLDVDDETFIRWFDFMGIQRHIKILGIFARLAIRDGKKEYIKDIPLTLKYVTNMASKYPELDELMTILKDVNT